MPSVLKPTTEPTVPITPASPVTLADLAATFGAIPIGRVRMTPAPGTATEADMLAANAGDAPGCELIDGTLVEKAVSFKSSKVAASLSGFLFIFLRDRSLGFIAGEQGFVRLPGLSGRWRGPDVAFYRASEEAEAAVERHAYPELTPALAVEVLSPGNSDVEIAGKVADYFQSGTELVWVIDPEAKTAKIYRAPEEVTEIDAAGTLEGRETLPGFSVKLGDLFAPVPSSDR